MSVEHGTVDHIIRHAAPTLAGLKTGNLFPWVFGDRRAFFQTLGETNRVLVPRGLRVIPLRLEEEKALLYLYRPSWLRRDLSQAQARDILSQAGYGDTDGPACLRELARRLGAGEGFPHEIGLFLGYPPEDVRGFIRYGGRGAKCTGCWKVYGDEAAARRTFAAYKTCTARYCRLRADGAALESLTVES